MDSNDSQFNMWNDFDLLSPLLCVNELYPILIVFNRFNPSIWNVFTDLKLPSPISIDSIRVNREKSNIVYPRSLQLYLLSIIEEIDWSIR